jgi:hypothetical protein
MTAQQKIAAPAAMAGRLLPVDPLAYDRHAMHAGERHWPQTNCYADLWIEILHALGPGAGGRFRLHDHAGFRG